MKKLQHIIKRKCYKNIKMFVFLYFCIFFVYFFYIFVYFVRQINNYHAENVCPSI